MRHRITEYIWTLVGIMLGCVIIGVILEWPLRDMALVFLGAACALALHYVLWEE